MFAVITVFPDCVFSVAFQFGNLPGIIVWEKPRMSMRFNNAPDSGGSFYTCFAAKVGDAVLDYKTAEINCVPHALKNLGVTLNQR